MAVEATSQIEYNLDTSLNRNGSNQSRLNLLQQGVVACNELLAQNPNDIAAYLKRGEFHHKLRQYALALDDYSQALEIQPEPAAYVGRAAVYNAMHRYQNALIEAEKALELDSRFAPAFIERGKAYKEMRLYAAALEDQNQALAIDSRIVDAYIQRGDVWLRFNLVDKALADYKKAIALDPNNADAYISRGAVALRRKRYDEALADCQRAINLNPTSAIAYNNRGVVYLQRRDYNRALTYLDYAAWLDPNNATIQLNRGMAYFRLKQYDIALSLFNYAINLDPSYGLAYNARGMALLRLGQHRQAAADFDYGAELSEKFEPSPTKIVSRFAKITPVSWPLIILPLVAYFASGLFAEIFQNDFNDALLPLTNATHGLINLTLLTGLVQLMLMIGLMVGVCNLKFWEIGWQKKNLPIAFVAALGLWTVAQLCFAVIDWFSTGNFLFNPALGHADILALLSNWLSYLITYGLVLQTVLFGFFTPQLYLKIRAEKPLNLATFVTTMLYVAVISFSSFEGSNEGTNYNFSYFLWWLILIAVFNLCLNFNNVFLSSLASAFLIVPLYLFVGNGFEWLPPLIFLLASIVWPTFLQQSTGQIYVD